MTYTQGNRVIIYKINAVGQPEIIQSLTNPKANLEEPQHAVFSHDGSTLIVANWTNQVLTIYQSQENGLFTEKPTAEIPSPSHLTNHRPHGIAVSPCGKFLAIAYGVVKCFGQAVALFQMPNCELLDILDGPEQLPGIPKGITFSPDSSCLLVTFSDLNSLVIFDVDTETRKIDPIPRQVIQGQETRIFRPEDVKISPNGNYCAVTNSDDHTVTFYPFDKSSNRVTQNTPSYILQNPEATFCFPHGIAFSPDGSFVAITDFGPLTSLENGGLYWDDTIKPDSAKVNLYQTRFKNWHLGDAKANF